jgi:hypothetical protein
MAAASSPASVIGDPARIASLVADAVAAADRRSEVAVEDVFLSQPGRLDDRTRAATLRLAETTIGAIEQQIAGDAARALHDADRREAAAVLESNRALAWSRLIEAGLMRDAELIGELIAQARVDLLDESLTALRAPDAGATLVTALVQSGAPAQRTAAIAYLVADSTRRLAAGGRQAILPAVLHTRVAWWVAAALRERLSGTGGVESDRVLADAAHRCLREYDETAGVDEAAARLVQALSPSTAERAELMVRALDSARTALFVALLAEALSIDAAEARALVLDSPSDRLWLALRAAGLPRDAIARAGFLLSEADRERDLSTLVEAVDTLAALDPAVAAEAISTARLPRDFRAAVRALARRSAA